MSNVNRNKVSSGLVKDKIFKIKEKVCSISYNDGARVIGLTMEHEPIQ